MQERKEEMMQGVDQKGREYNDKFLLSLLQYYDRGQQQLILPVSDFFDIYNTEIDRLKQEFKKEKEAQRREEVQ